MKICKKCGDEFEGKKNQKYCSRDCAVSSAMATYYYKKRKRKKCIKCGVDIGHTRSSLCVECRRKKTLGKYVPLEDISKLCPVCGKDFKTKKSIQKYCSYECRKKARNDRRIFSDTSKSRMVKESVGKCEFCGFDNMLALHVHHVIQTKGEQYNKDNLMVLCANHHYIYHGIMGRNKRSEEMTKEEVLAILQGAENEPEKT